MLEQTVRTFGQTVRTLEKPLAIRQLSVSFLTITKYRQCTFSQRRSQITLTCANYHFDKNLFRLTWKNPGSQSWRQYTCSQSYHCELSCCTARSYIIHPRHVILESLCIRLNKQRCIMGSVKEANKKDFDLLCSFRLISNNYC